MQMKFFWIPAQDSAAAEQELNTFLAAHRIVQVEKSFCPAAERPPGWALCVQWLPGTATMPGKAGAPTGEAGGREKIDYREVLDAETFRIYAALRTWRKDAAAAQGVPVYTVATNEQLAAIARQRLQTRAGLAEVEGFGQSRMTKYAADLLAVCEREMAISTGPAPENP